MTVYKAERELGGRTLTIETGKLAKQAHGSALVRYGDTVVLVAVTYQPVGEDAKDFFPLTVDYREKTYAAGKFPGGFIKREGRPTNKEILTMRMIDRPVRPLFPPNYRDEVQIMAMVLSADQQNDPDILAMIGASAALSVSPVPFQGPIGAVRVGRIGEQFILNPTHSQLDDSVMKLVIAGREEAVNMIEFQGKEVQEDVVAEAIKFGHDAVKQIVEMINELARQVGPEKIEVPAPPEQYSQLLETVRDKAQQRIEQAKGIAQKQARNEAMQRLEEEILAELCPPDQEQRPYEPAQVVEALHEVERQVVRRMILNGKRVDGRSPRQIRPLSCEVGVLPRTHGSAIFTRGETQALVVTTLGTAEDVQIVEGLVEEYSQKFMLHYNFPPFSVGEVRPIRGPSRREIGHGALAERCLEVVLPDVEQFPYTIRLVSDILESNGSSSMATVCGGTLALMDAGVPISDPVAGISIGMVREPEGTVLLTDIVGEEDHFGDMDFKIAGTQHGVTGIQLDLKTEYLPQELVLQALHQAREARIEILKHMLTCLSAPREQISEHAPRLITIKIDPEKIGKVIGPGGKTVKRIQEQTGATIEIEDDGTVFISSLGMEGAERARDEIELITEDVKVGRIYTGKVIAIKEFGAFLELVPGQDGLCHISELAEGYVQNVSDVCKIGDEMRVKVIAIDDHGRIKLSRRAVLREKKGEKVPS